MRLARCSLCQQGGSAAKDQLPWELKCRLVLWSSFKERVVGNKGQLCIGGNYDASRRGQSGRKRAGGGSGVGH